MPKRISNPRRVRVDYEDDDFVRAPRRRSILRRAIGAVLPRRVSDTIALAIATAAALAVVVNAVAFQETPRSTLDSLLSQDTPNPQPRPNDAPARSVTDLIQNIQRELSVAAITTARSTVFRGRARNRQSAISRRARPDRIRSNPATIS